MKFGCLSDMLHYLLSYDTTLNLQVSTSMLITLECEFLLPLLGAIFRTAVEKRNFSHKGIGKETAITPRGWGNVSSYVIANKKRTRGEKTFKFFKTLCTSLNIKNKHGF